MRARLARFLSILIAGFCSLGMDQSRRRSVWARRARDIVQAHVSDLGGADNTSEAERSIVRRAAAITTELERLECIFATEGEARPDQIDLYYRGANSLRRLLEAVGLERRARDIGPVSLTDYVKAKSAETAS